MSTIDNIVLLLKEQNKTQKDLCDFLGVTKNAFTDWKSGRIKSYTKYLPQIAEYFDVSVDYLLGKTDKIEKPSASGELPDKNVVTIIGRDGRYIQKKLTDEQIRALETIIDQMPDAPDDI